MDENLNTILLWEDDYYKRDWKLRGITKLREWLKNASSRVDKKVEGS
jgi:hypothetical protein